MTNIDKVIVAKRLALITRYLSSLKKFEGQSLEEYLSNFETQMVVERLIQLMTQAAIDINEHILSSINPGNSTTNFEAFIEIGKYDIINPGLAKQLAPSAGLRNRLVHEYDDIDSSQVFLAINFALSQYPLYVQQISTYLNSLDAGTRSS
ncbi:MAG: DUF86 domain-containing protein [Scytonematopsis contorta HA4267-MV1]|jgi:uncharacterized protein YutE (UPF0331/DUF86 family)|nr:DUF86 domain-containing protein [Scytonematopsis contorta HA4267-MV1]